MLDELFFRINTSVETIVNVGIAIATATTLRIWKSVSKGDSVKMNSVNNWKKCFLVSFLCPCVYLIYGYIIH